MLGRWWKEERRVLAKRYGSRSRLVRFENVGGLNEFSFLPLLLFIMVGRVTVTNECGVFFFFLLIFALSSSCHLFMPELRELK